MCMGTSMNNDAASVAVTEAGDTAAEESVDATVAEAAKRLQNHDLLGFRLNPGTISDYIHFIADAINTQQRQTVFYHNLHSLYSYFTSARLEQCYDREGITVLADGMPLIWLMKLVGFKATREQRVTYVDFIWPMLEAARDNNWKVYHIGQEKSVQDKALLAIRERLPGLQIEGHDGYFDMTDNSEDSHRVIESVNQYGTDLLLVGFGAPKQEYWLDAHRQAINASAVFTCGACMEYVAGVVKTPPRWMGKAGLEWLYRLTENPRRFAFRYLVEPLILGLILARNLVFRRNSKQRPAEATTNTRKSTDKQASG